MNLHVHAPQPDKVWEQVMPCPTCKKPRRFLREHTPWYGVMDTCLCCGEAWQDGERMPRPFARAWRERNVEQALGRLERFLKRTGKVQQGTIEATR